MSEQRVGLSVEPLMPEPGVVSFARGIPSPETFRTDVGLGLDFTNLGLYVAKATSDLKEPANFLVRVRRRI